MGFYVNQSAKARCPLYETFVRSSNEKIAGVQCGCMSSGEGVSFIVRFHGFRETMKHKQIYCDSQEHYQSCPYYRAWMRSVMV